MYIDLSNQGMVLVKLLVNRISRILHHPTLPLEQIFPESSALQTSSQARHPQPSTATSGSHILPPTWGNFIPHPWPHLLPVHDQSANIPKIPSQHTSSTTWYLPLPLPTFTEYIHALQHTIPITLGTTHSIIAPYISHKDLILYITTIHTVVPYTPKYRFITATSN